MYKFFHRWKVQRNKAVFASRVSVTTPRAAVLSGNMTRTMSPLVTCMSDRAFLAAFWAFFDLDFGVDVMRGISKMS